LFLDEIGDLDFQNQVKLLRLIQERDYLPLGADKPHRASVRILAATNRNLTDLIAKGAFRNDLYHRLNTHHIHLPPLRERKQDIPMLTEYFLKTCAAEMEKKAPAYPPELLVLFSNYDFPGNIRELRSLIFDAVAANTHPVLSLDSFKKTILNDKSIPKTAASDYSFSNWSTLPELRVVKDQLIEEALRRTDGNQSMAADMLGISRITIINYLKQK